MKENGYPDILLVVPNLPASSWLNALAAGVTASLGVAYVAGHLMAKGFKVRILDNAAELLSRQQFIDYLRKVRPKTVGFTSSTTTFPQVVEFAAAVKEFDRGIPVIIGGPHASALPVETLKNEFLDIAVKGEGEETAAELLAALLGKESLTNIKGIAYKDENKIRDNHPRELIGDIDKLEFPAYELLPMHRYHPSLSRRLSSGNMGSIITSRGCTYRCTFCSNSVFGFGIRQRSPENVLDEIKYLIKNYSIQELIIWDDTFTINPERAKAIAVGIKRVDRGILWSCYGRLDHITDDLCSVFYESGCREILFGAESGSNIVLQAAKKQITIDQTLNAVSLCRKHRISSFCSVIIGLPFDTVERVYETIRFFIKINPDYAAFCVLVPFPGSELFNFAVAEKKINIRRAVWSDYVKLFSSRLPPVSLCDIPPDKLVQLQKEAFRSFFFRPSYIMGRLRKCVINMDMRKLRSFGRGFFTIIRHQLHRFK